MTDPYRCRLRGQYRLLEYCLNSERFVLVLLSQFHFEAKPVYRWALKANGYWCGALASQSWELSPNLGDGRAGQAAAVAG